MKKGNTRKKTGERKGLKKTEREERKGNVVEHIPTG